VPAAATQPDINPSPTSHQTVTSSHRNSSLVTLCLKCTVFPSSFNPFCPVPTVLRMVCSWSAPFCCRICRSMDCYFFRFVMFSIGFKHQKVCNFLPTFDTISFISESKIWKVYVLFDFLRIPFRGSHRKKFTLLSSVIMQSYQFSCTRLLYNAKRRNGSLFMRLQLWWPCTALAMQPVLAEVGLHWAMERRDI
jgi:hypothetical protein